jgi:hypothetical protein
MLIEIWGEPQFARPPHPLMFRDDDWPAARDGIVPVDDFKRVA